MKRKWEGFTGVPLPAKKLRTSEPDDVLAESNQNQKPAAKTVKKAMMATAAPAAPPAMPPHPDDRLNVDKMIVNELRKELKKRKLGTGGRKAELQARLREYLAEARTKREADWAAKHAVKEAETQIKKVKISAGSTEQMDVVMEDTNEEDVSLENDVKEVGPAKKKAPAAKVTKTKSNDDSMETEPVSKPAAKPTVASLKNNYQSAATKQAPKSALKPSKYVAASNGTPQLDNAKPVATKPAPSSMTKRDMPAPKQILPHKVSDSSIESSASKPVAAASMSTTKSSTKLQSSVQKTKISSTLAQTTPSESAFKTKTSAAGSAKLLEKKKAHAAATEARKARMAEMRQKVRRMLFHVYFLILSMISNSLFQCHP